MIDNEGTALCYCHLAFGKDCYLIIGLDIACLIATKY